MKKILDSFKWGTIVFLILTVLDLIFELFQINQSGKVVTLFGVVIESVFTSEKLEMIFSLNSRMFFAYLMTILIFLGVGFMFGKKTHRRF